WASTARGVAKKARVKVASAASRANRMGPPCRLGAKARLVRGDPTRKPTGTPGLGSADHHCVPGFLSGWGIGHNILLICPLGTRRRLVAGRLAAPRPPPTPGGASEVSRLRMVAGLYLPEGLLTGGQYRAARLPRCETVWERQHGALWGGEGWGNKDHPPRE